MDGVDIHFIHVKSERRNALPMIVTHGWTTYGAEDLAVPLAAPAFMAERAHARKVQVVPGASHVVMISHPHDVAGLIEQVATATK